MDTEYKVPMDGIIENLDKYDIEFFDSFMDIAGNHFLDNLTPETVEIIWNFEPFGDKSDLYLFNKTEIKGTGAGMTKSIVVNDFFGVPTKENKNNRQVESLGVSIYGQGEKTNYANSTKGELSKPYRETHGFLNFTKTSDNEKYILSIFNMFDVNKDNGGWIQKPTELSYEEAMKENLPADIIGDKGSHSQYVVDASSWGKDWFNILKNRFENVFADYLITNKYKVTFIDPNGVKHVLKEKYIPSNTGDYKQETWSGNINIDGKTYSTKIFKRPLKGSPEYNHFNKLYGEDRRAFQTNAGYGFAKNCILVFRDKKRGYIYNARQMKLSNHNRYTIVMEVDKSDLSTDITKSSAKLIGKNDNPIDHATMSELIKEKLNSLFPSNMASETQLREQLLSVLYGEKHIQYDSYKKLCEILDIPVGDYEYAKDNLQPEYNVEGVSKNPDIWDTTNKAIWELKNKLPDPDKDFNQIVTYFTLMKNKGVKRIITLAVGDNPFNEQVKGVNTNFSKVLRSKFSTDLNANENTNTARWDIVDLAYFGLHRLIR